MADFKKGDKVSTVGRIALIIAYLIGMVVAVFMLNADGSSESAFAIWMAASVLLGWGTGNPMFAILPFLAIPLAIPFGIPDDPASRSADPVFPVALGAAYYALFSGMLIVLFAMARRKLGPRLRRLRLRQSVDS